VQGKLTSVFNSLVYTQRSIPYQVTMLTGITNEAIQKAPRQDIVMNKFISFLKNYRLVFHNADFDMRFIIKYTNFYQLSISNPISDTLKLSREKLPSLSSHKLQTLVEHFKIKSNPTHRAKDDSIATGLLYLNLAELKVSKRKSKSRLQKKQKTASRPKKNNAQTDSIANGFVDVNYRPRSMLCISTNIVLSINTETQERFLITPNETVELDEFSSETLSLCNRGYTAPEILSVIEQDFYISNFDLETEVIGFINIGLKKGWIDYIQN
jgi:DNA polymerase III epsilon subunit-like protein